MFEPKRGKTIAGERIWHALTCERLIDIAFRRVIELKLEHRTGCPNGPDYIGFDDLQDFDEDMNDREPSPASDPEDNEDNLSTSSPFTERRENEQAQPRKKTSEGKRKAKLCK